MSRHQTGISGYFTQYAPRFELLPEYPKDEELEDLIAPSEQYPFDPNELDEIHELRAAIRDAEYSANPIEGWTEILSQHISFRNTKLSERVAIFNMNAAHDCVHLGTERCQVTEGDGICYAYRAERDYPHPLDYRRRQQIVWDHIDPATWARAYKRIVDARDIDTDIIRFSQSGDFRTRNDLLKVNEIGRLLEGHSDIYVYTASSQLDWTEAEHFTVNLSFDGEGGDRRYIVVENESEIPASEIHCPYDKFDGEIKCGSCRLCIDGDAGDVYTVLKT